MIFYPSMDDVICTFTASLFFFVISQQPSLPSKWWQGVNFVELFPSRRRTNTKAQQTIAQQKWVASQNIILNYMYTVHDWFPSINA